MRGNCNRLIKILFCCVLIASIIAPSTSTPVMAQVLPGLADVSREVAAEGIVLLQNPDYKVAGSQVNENEQVLPIKKSENVSVFGRIQAHYYKSGTGSGGAVRVDYVNGILEGLRNNPSLKLNEDLAKNYADWIKTHPFNNGGGGWAAEPWSQAEMPLTDEIVDEAKAKTDTAVVIIGRTAGEDKDNTDVKGAYRLTDLEVDMLNRVYAKFDRVAIVLNVANVIDMSWAKDYPQAAILYTWQGGMEGGSAVADVLTGDVTPSGKLSDTIAATLADYPSTAHFGSKTENSYSEDIYVGYRYFETFAPDKVLYPFGYGLSYTNFKITTDSVNAGENEVAVSVTVQNTGKVEGKEVVQIYYGAPQGKLGKPAKELAAFAKTRLLQPGESQSITITYDTKEMASYDDSGITGHDSSYVLEAGDYNIYVGDSVRDSNKQGTYTLNELKVVETLQEALAPTKDFDRIKPGQPNGNGTFTAVSEKVPTRTNNLDERIKKNLPAGIPQTGDKGYTLLDVYNKKVTMDQFIAQFSNNDLGAIILGEGMSSPKVTAGTAAAFGGVTKNLLKFGLPIDSAADGPSGIRMETNAEKATSIPNGTMLACTWNTELNERLFDLLGKEMLLNNIDTLLGPGINIHRSPLNGRNFEYFSEDPLLTGIMAAAQTRGLQKNGTAPTIKHFVANNQETDRHLVNALVSERALREIYLKGYEMAVKSGKARSVMTSYGPVNGTWASSNYDLNTTILREEWGFEGIVMTDWWAKMSEDQGFYATSNGYDETNGKAMVRAQNDLYMVIPNDYAETHKNRNNSTFNTMTSLANGSLTLGELQRSAKNITSFLMQSPAFARTAKIDYVVNYTPGRDWFRVDAPKLGDPQLTGITVGGKKIIIFDPLKLDYKAFGETANSSYPEVKATANADVNVTVRQADKDRSATVITATAGGEKRIYKVIFTSQEGLEPIFENPTYAYLKSISVGGKPLEGFAQTRFSYDVGLTNGAALPQVTFEANPDVNATLNVDPVNKRVTIKCISTDQANSYVIQFGTTPQSDEFDSTTLSRFWTINKETANNGENSNNWSLKNAPGFLGITAERGDFWTDHTDLKNYFQQEAFGNWEATVKINMSKVPSQNYNSVGITASQDSNNYIWVKYEHTSGKVLGMVKEIGGTAPVTIGQVSASQLSSIFGEKKELYLRLKKIGNSYSGYVSADGNDYISLGSTTADYSNPKFGLLASNGSQTPSEPFSVDFDYVRINNDVALTEKNIGKNTKLKVAETEFASITPVITPVTCNDVDGGLCYTNTNKGEAISYKVKVEKEGVYKITSRIRSSQSDVAQMSFGVYDGDKHLGTFDLNTTKGEWKTFRIPDVNLSAGEHTLRIVFESAGIDLNWLKFQLKQDDVGTSALDAAIKAAQNIDTSAYSSYKKLKFNAVLEEAKDVLGEPINDEVVAEAIATLNATIEELGTSSMPVNIVPKETQSVKNGIRIFPYHAPWIYATNDQFKFEDGTDAMSYVNSNDLVYFGQIDLTNLEEVRVQYAREGNASPSFKFYTEADYMGKPTKRSTTQGRVYDDVYNGDRFFELGNEFASINFAQKAGAAWNNYGIASTKQTPGNPYIDHYLGEESNFVDRTKATGKRNVYMRFNGLNANLQYVELIYGEQVEATFDLDYPEAPAPTKVSVLKGKAFGTLPQAPVREGYIFSGWFDNKEGNGNALTSETVLNASTVFYAKWTKDNQVREIVSIAQPQLLSVSFGTSADDLNLPAKVEATLGNNMIIGLDVQWDSKDYDGGKVGEYTLAGTFKLPEGVLNSANKTVSITVVVLPEGTQPIKITEVENLKSRSVDFGTTFDKLELPPSVTVTLDTYGTKALAVKWSSAGYNGNAEGSYALNGTLVLEEGIINPNDQKASITVNVLPEVVKLPEIKAVQALEGKSVVYGTGFAGLELPAAVSVTLSTGETKTVSVHWSNDGYNGNKAGTYIIKGNLILPTGVVNPQVQKAEISVVVRPYSGGGSDGGDKQPGRPTVPGEVVKPSEQQPQPPATGEMPKTPEQIKKELSNRFKDASLIPSWAEAAIAALAEKKIIGGRSDGSFNPSGNVNRTEFLAMVVRSFNFSIGENQNHFTDVLSDAWYKNYVEIGTYNNLINGVGNGLFAPNKNISRQDLCVIIFNALKKLNVELPQGSNHAFPDDASIAGYAKEAVYALKELGIVKGGTSGKMDPTASATRAEAAVIIKNMLVYYASVTSATAK